jgi:hypothetical protein
MISVMRKYFNRNVSSEENAPLRDSAANEVELV